MAALVGAKAELVHLLLSVFWGQARDMDTVQGAEQQRALLAQTAMDQDRCTLRVTAEVEELLHLGTCWRILVVAGYGYEVDSEGITRRSFGLFPGVGV